jgi:hypothetical protein
MSAEGSNAEVFVYMGEGGAVVPQDVVRLRVDHSVTSIHRQAFHGRKKLAEVELYEGLLEIGDESFARTDHSITKINIPSTLRRIKDYSFICSLRTPIRLHVESIGADAFSGCIFTNFRVPPLITAIPDAVMNECFSLFSLELPETVTEIRSNAFSNCHSLRNVVIPPNANLADDVFNNYEDQERLWRRLDQLEGKSNVFQRSYKKRHVSDLQQLFGGLFGCSDEIVLWELKHRFDELPVHSVVYYQSYHEGVLQRLLASKLDPTGNQQDCLGMTPLHILACSSVHDLELYRVIVERYPTNLITKDRWGALPLLYAFWGDAPSAIIQFLLESYQSLYPRYKFNWTMMVQTMGRCDTPKESIENLLLRRQRYFPEQPIDWEYLLNEFFKPSDFYMPGAPFQGRMRFLVMCGMSSRVEALAFNVWRDCITQMIHAADFNSEFNKRKNNKNVLRSILNTLVHFEDELPSV